MFEKFRGGRDGETAGNGRFTRDPERPHGNVATATRTEAQPAAHTAPTGTVATEHMREIRREQRAEFGGFNWGAAFFGWLVAFGLAALLGGLIGATGAAIGLTEGTTPGEQQTIGLAGGIALVVASLLAYFGGGYVAGRMSRFDGARQGFGTWLFGLIVTAVIGVLAVALGSEYNIIGQAELPRLTVGEETATTAGIVVMLAMLIGTLLAAVAGGKAGERYHRKIDRFATRNH